MAQSVFHFFVLVLDKNCGKVFGQVFVIREIVSSFHQKFITKKGCACNYHFNRMMYNGFFVVISENYLQNWLKNQHGAMKTDKVSDIVVGKFSVKTGTMLTLT